MQIVKRDSSDINILNDLLIESRLVILKSSLTFQIFLPFSKPQKLKQKLLPYSPSHKRKMKKVSTIKNYKRITGVTTCDVSLLHSDSSFCSDLSDTRGRIFVSDQLVSNTGQRDSIWRRDISHRLCTGYANINHLLFLVFVSTANLSSIREN